MAMPRGHVASPATAARPASPWRGAARAGGLALLILILTLIAIAALGSALGRPELAADVLSLAIPAFLAGALSFLSPCSLPLVAGYFSLAIQERGERIPAMTVAFLAGVATTMSVLGASFTALGAFVVAHQPALTKIGGLIVVGFGLMSLLGKGFAGVRLFGRPAATVSGAYVYGLIFALGWTTCVGPILGAILTLLLTQGSSVGGAIALVGGATLALLYTLGLGAPLLVIVTALQRAGPGNPVARLLRGRGWALRLAGRTWHLHSTMVTSGLLLIALGVLMITGQLTAMGERLAGSPLAQLGVELERWLDRLL